jgi:hypothetical protein
MQPLQQYYIAGSKSGYINYQKPFLTPDDGYQTLENALVYRDRVIERPGLTFFGRLRRAITAQNAGNISSGTPTLNIITGLTLETNAEIAPGSVAIPNTFAIGAQILTDTTRNGVLVVTGAGPITAARINYATGVLSITTGAMGATAVVVTMKYYPGLPVMGIYQLEQSDINKEKTIFFDTKYAYVNLTGSNDDFNEYLAIPVTWSGSNSDFFYATNWIGSVAYQRLFFVTNFVNNASNPMRYTNDAVWTTFSPLVDATNTLFQARILIPYYGRLLALNTYEGLTVNGAAGANNYFARCRFSQIGDPTAVDGWGDDVFGKGGFIDAPTDEAIISAIFYKNTLIVGFERSTWQLRYVGEYGLPFIWERISSDFGCESTCSPVLFDQGVLQVGDRAIVNATATNVQRIDDQIPDLVFSFKNDEFGKARVIGIRDFQNELVYWCWIDTGLQKPNNKFTFPNSTLVYNYRNGTYAIWRNNVTFFGTYQNPVSVLWSSTTTKWGNFNILWRSAGNAEFPTIVSGNQQGYISKFTTALYDGNSIDEPSLSIHAIDLTLVPCQITIPNHNLVNDDWIRITTALFDITDPGINGKIYNVKYVSENVLSLFEWNIVTQSFVDVDFTSSPSAAAIYQGLGEVSFYPVMNIVSKDFNPYQQQGSQVKLSYIDFLVDSQDRGQFAVNLYVNTFLGDSANIITGNKNVEESWNLFGYITNLTIDNTNTNPCIVTSPNHGLRTNQTVFISNVTGTTQINNLSYTVTYIDANNYSIDADQTTFSAYLGGGDWLCNQVDLFPYGSNYAWHRFFATTTGQFVTFQITYNNDQMSNLSTQRTNLTLNAVSLYTRSGSRNVF